METRGKQISYFKNCRSKKPLKVNFDAALHWIKSGSSKELIDKIRKAKDQEQKDALKANLPGVTFGGVFKGRTDLIASSGFACLDFDKVSDLEQLKASLRASKYIYSFWLSPSGNGVKALVQIPIVESKVEYQSYYKAILRRFKELNPDIATKDINRLCFESYDPDLYLNKDAEVFKQKIVTKAKPQPPIKNNNAELPEGKVIDRIVSWWVKKFPFAKGSRNNSLFVLACALSNFGVNKSTTEDLFYSFEDEDFHYNEIKQIIDSAYKRAEFNSQSFSK